MFVMVGKLLSTILSALLIFALTGCGGGSEGTGSVEIRGAVTDSSGNPIPQASVLALTTGDSATSDVSGAFVIDAYKDGETFTVNTPAGTFTESTQELTPQALYLFKITEDGRLEIESGEEALAEVDPINESNNHDGANNTDKIVTGGESKPNKNNQNRDDEETAPTILALNADVTLNAGSGVTVGNVILPTTGSTLESPVTFVITSAGQQINLSKVADGQFTAEISTKHFFLKVSYDGVEIASGRVNLTGDIRQAELSFRINVDNSEATVTAVQASDSDLSYDLKIKESSRQREEDAPITQVTEAPKAEIEKDEIKAEIPVDLAPTPDLNVEIPTTPQEEVSIDTESTSSDIATQVTEEPASETLPTPDTQPTGPKLGK